MAVPDWEANLADCIRLVGTKSELTRAWLGGDPNFASSFGEVVTILFNDLDIDLFLAKYASTSTLSALEIAALVSFRDALDAFDGQIKGTRIYKDEARILRDSAWQQVMQLAAEFSAEYFASRDAARFR